MTAPVFVDTNVLVYARDAGDAAKQARAAAWLEFLWREQVGRTSMQVLSEYYVTLTRKLDPGVSTVEAWDDVSALLTWHPQAIDRAIMQRGREIEQRHRLSWWDSLIVAAAAAQGCALLLSEDLQDGGVYAGVAALGERLHRSGRDVLTAYQRLTGEIQRKVPRFTIYPGSHYVTPKERVQSAVEEIRGELRAHFGCQAFVNLVEVARFLRVGSDKHLFFEQA